MQTKPTIRIPNITDVIIRSPIVFINRISVPGMIDDTGEYFSKKMKAIGMWVNKHLAKVHMSIRKSSSIRPYCISVDEHPRRPNDLVQLHVLGCVISFWNQKLYDFRKVDSIGLSMKKMTDHVFDSIENYLSRWIQMPI